MTSTHVVVGSGPVGTGIARALTGAGHEVVLASRSGSGPDIPGARRVSLDAADAESLTRTATGAAVIYNAVNPAGYHTWPTVWPPIAAALLSAAERTGAVLATVSNLYAYGRVTGAMTAATPLVPADIKGKVRKRMWLDALAAHQAGRVRTVEVRASDFVGAGTGVNSHSARVASFVLRGKRASVIGLADMPHSWTYVGDVAHCLIAAAADPDAHGQAWHVPTNPPRTQRQLAADIARVAGTADVAVSGTPTLVFRVMGLFDRRMSAVADSAYQFRIPFVIDDTAARERFGLIPTSWDQVLTEVVADVRATIAAGAR